MSDTLCANTIRVLAAEMVQKANSGHPGAPMGLAPTAHVLFSKILRFDAKNPSFWGRDRFILSNGHACSLLYSMLHLSGYDVSLDDLKAFRSIGSITPGHPERGVTPGVEVTTGPLGQGIANAVGMAIAEKHLAAVYNKTAADGTPLDLFNNKVYAICGDGCLQEGVSYEALSLAGTLQLDKLVIIWDDNSIQIDGSTGLAFTENVVDRFKAMGFRVVTVSDGDNDFKSIEDAITSPTENNKPTLVQVKTTIGYLAKKQGTEAVHGAPLGQADIDRIKQTLSFPVDKSFNISDEVRDVYTSMNTRQQEYITLYNNKVNIYKNEYPTEYNELVQRMNGELPTDWKDHIPTFGDVSQPDSKATIQAKADATRNSSGIVLNKFAPIIPSLVGGSADLTPSNKTWLSCSHNYGPTTIQGAEEKVDESGRYIRYGVREHAMCAINNGLAAYGGFIPFSATFLNFITYAWGAVRLSALSHHKHIFIMTHDSIGLGEDGPTHQPIETLALLRSTPNVLCLRPADQNETSGSYAVALQHNGPSVLCLSRQNLPVLTGNKPQDVLNGGYIVYEENLYDTTDDAKYLILAATGSEVNYALETAKLLKQQGKESPLSSQFNKIRVVSIPSFELLDRTSTIYRQELFRPAPLSYVVSLEAANERVWASYSHTSVSMSTFGASAPTDVLYKHFGFTSDRVIPFIVKESSIFKDSNTYPALRVTYAQPSGAFTDVKDF